MPSRRSRRAILLLLGLGGAAALGFLPRARFDPSVHALIAEQAGENRELERRFGIGAELIVGIEADDVLGPEVLRRIDRLGRRIEARLDASVLSITQAPDVAAGRFGPQRIVPYRQLRSGTIQPQDFRRWALDQPLLRGLLLARNAQAAALLIEAPLESSAQRRRAVATLQELLAQAQWRGARLHLAGLAVVEEEIARASRADLARVLPAVLLLIACALLLRYRTVAALGVCFGAVLLSLLLGVAVYGLLGFRFNMIAILLPPALAIIAVENAIHLLDRYLEQRRAGAAPEPAAWAASRQLRLPCLLTSVTTAVGFLSLSWAEAPALREFGFGAAAAVLLTWVVTYFGIPAALPEAGVDRRLARGAPRSDPLRRLALGLGQVARRRAGTVGVLCAAAALVLGAGLPRLTVSSSILSALPPDSPSRRAERFLDQHLSGSQSLEILIRPQSDSLDPGFLRRLEAFQRRAAAMPEVRHALSPVDLVKRVQRAAAGERSAARLSASDEELREWIELIEDAPESRALLARDPAAARLTLRLGRGAALDLEALMDRLIRAARRLLPGSDLRFAGRAVELSELSRQVVRSQRRSLLFALGAIALLLGVLLGSLRWGLLAILPNALALLGVYGLMGWLALPLSLPTAMIAAVALGLAVDVAVQLLARYRHELATRPAHALERSLARTGSSNLAASAVLVAGFWAGGLGALAPTRHFAVLTGLALLLALLTDLVLLPVLLDRLRGADKRPPM